MKSSIPLSDSPLSESKITLVDLWREFLPLSMSDVTMACGDPVVTLTLAYLPDSRQNLAALGVAKSLAIFFESPIIMILHASNALAGNRTSRLALWRFTLIAGTILSGLLVCLAIPPVFSVLGKQWLGIPDDLAPLVQQIIAIMGGWAFVIAWRRYFQGLLIYHGQSKVLAKASLLRLFVLCLVLAIGFSLKIYGWLLAAIAMMVGVTCEALMVTFCAYRLGVTAGAALPDVLINTVIKEKDSAPVNPSHPNLPQTLGQVWKFYHPLANSMLVVWGGRALLLSLLSRSVDATIAIASWSAAWGLVLVIANSSRMVQQIIIKYRNRVRDRRLFLFALSVGLICSGLLLVMAGTPIGEPMVMAFIGNDPILALQIKPVLWVCAIVPLLTALQNAGQGFLVSQGKTKAVNFATWLGTSVLLTVAFVSIQNHLGGAIAAAIGMVAAMSTELGCLVWQLKKSRS